jgi:hypothetical protein
VAGTSAPADDRAFLRREMADSRRILPSNGRRQKEEEQAPDKLPIALALFAEVQRKLLELQEMEEFCGRRGRAARFGCGPR